MLVERLKLSVSVWLALGLFLGVLGGIGFSKITMEEKPKVNPADIPRRRVTIIINQSQQDELYTQLRKFADKWDYAIRIAPVVPNDNTEVNDLKNFINKIPNATFTVSK